MKLKMWNGLLCRRMGDPFEGSEHIRQVSARVVASSQKRAAELIGGSVGYFRDYWSLDARDVPGEEGVWQAAKDHMPKWPDDYFRQGEAIQ